MDKRLLGRTGYLVTPICFGTSPLGLPARYGGGVSFADAVRTMRAALMGPFNLIDTSNGYGNSERQIGRAIAERGGLPSGIVLATKVDPLPGSNDLSGSRVRASVAESLERLGLDSLQLVHLHDPERVSFADAMAAGGAVEALVALRDEGVIRHLGVAGLESSLLRQYLETDVFDVVLSHNQFTLIDQGASALFDYASSRGIGVLNAAPYGGGMLAKGPKLVPVYCYGIDSADIRRRAHKMLSLCDAAGVPLAAAALQFSLSDPRITSTVVGMRNSARLLQTLRLASWPIPDSLWDSLRPFIFDDTMAASGIPNRLAQLRPARSLRSQ